MRIDKNSRLNCIGLMLAWTLGGCSGGDPAQSPTPTPAVSLSPSVAASPATTASPSDEFTPAPGVSPLGGKPLSEEEKEYQLKLKKAEEFTLSRNYEEGIPLLEELHKENPKELATLFYLLLSYGTNEDIPVKDSKAYNYAQKILTLDPNSREAAKARYLRQFGKSGPTTRFQVRQRHCGLTWRMGRRPGGDLQSQNRHSVSLLHSSPTRFRRSDHTLGNGGLAVHFDGA